MPKRKPTRTPTTLNECPSGARVKFDCWWRVAGRPGDQFRLVRLCGLDGKEINETWATFPYRGDTPLTEYEAPGVSVDEGDVEIGRAHV